MYATLHLVNGTQIASVRDIEVTNGGVVWIVAQRVGGGSTNYLCEVAQGATSCTSTSTSTSQAAIYINDGGSAERTDQWQYYDQYGHSVLSAPECSDTSILDSTYQNPPTSFTPTAKLVAIGNELPGTSDKFVIYSNPD